MAVLTVVPQFLTARPSLKEATKLWAHVGVLSFGGPAGQIALMHRLLVSERQWIDEDRFLHALNYCMLLPGPEAQQLATYIGWLLHGVRGGLIAGLLFILPGFAVMMGLSSAYALFQGAAWLTALFFGLKASVLALVIQALVRLGGRALKTNYHRLIAAISFVALFFFNIPFPFVIVLAAVIGIFLVERKATGDADGDRASFVQPSQQQTARPAFQALRTIFIWLLIWQAPFALFLALSASGMISGSDGVHAFTEIFSFFSRMAFVTFGGAYAVLSYAAQLAVDHYHWLRPGEMIDGLALAETTPGPLVLVLCFIGFMAGFRHAGPFDPLAAGLLGGVLTAWATFVPSFLFIFAGAPYVERLRSNRWLSGALASISAAVVGVIAALALWFGLHVLFADVGRVTMDFGFGRSLIGFIWPSWHSLDLPALAIFAFAAVMLLRFRVGLAATLALCGLAGMALKLAVPFF